MFYILSPHTHTHTHTHTHKAKASNGWREVHETQTEEQLPSLKNRNFSEVLGDPSFFG